MDVRHVPGALGGPQRESDSLELVLQAIVSSWEPNCDPPQELHLILTVEPFPQTWEELTLTPGHLGQIYPSLLLIMPQ